MIPKCSLFFRIRTDGIITRLVSRCGTQALIFLHTDAQHEATITFVGTGAGYNNSLGVYNIAEDGTIRDVQITFGNVKNFKAGDTADITLPGAPDSDFGFFIIADGARQNNNYCNLDFDEGTLNFWFDYGQAGQRLATINDDGDRISLVFSDGQSNTVLRGDVYHTTERGGSTDLNADEANHVVSGLVNECDPANYTALAIIEGGKNLDLQTMINQGSLIV